MLRTYLRRRETGHPSAPPFLSVVFLGLNHAIKGKSMLIYQQKSISRRGWYGNETKDDLLALFITDYEWDGVSVFSVGEYENIELLKTMTEL